MVPNLRNAIYLKIVVVWVSEYENGIYYVQVIHYYHILLINVIIEIFVQFHLPNEKLYLRNSHQILELGMYNDINKLKWVEWSAAKSIILS